MDDEKAIRTAKLTAKSVNKRRDTASENIADYVAELLRQGRASEITDDLMAQADPQRLHQHYVSGNTGQSMPMDQASRMARAEQMGFDAKTPLYHGTQADFLSHIPSNGSYGRSVYATTDFEKASRYADNHGDNPVGANVQPLLSNAAYRSPPPTNFQIDDPTNIRSQFARFDPRLTHLSHLSASTGGAMELARAVMAKDRAQGQIAPSKYLPNVPRQAHADGGEVDPLAPPPVDLGQVREQKQLQGFHQNLMSDVDNAVSDRMQAHQKALDAGVFDGYEVGDTLKGKVAPMRITGRFVRPWKPSMQASFDRLGAKPTLIEHEGKHYVPMLRTLTGVEGKGDWQESDAYLDLVRAMGYPKMGGLRAVKADGGSVFGGMTRDQFLGEPKITSDANAADLKPRALPELDDVDHEAFPLHGLRAKYSENGAAVFDGEKPVASYNFGNTLVVDPKYRKRGIGSELVYQWRSRFPQAKPSQYRTRTAQRIQEKVWDRIQREGRADGGSVADRSPMFEGMHEDLRDETGKPLDLWHGTPAPEPFEAFDNAKLGKRDAGFYGRGHYLTPTKGNAEGYADPDEVGTGTVMGPLHAALKNPYVWDASDNGSHRTLRDLQSMGIMREKSELEPWDNLQRHHIDPFMREMQKRGHDGVLMKTNRGLSEIVVFNPNMIKHRDAEVGDPNDPRIMRAGGGKVELYSKAAKVVRGLKDNPMQVGDIVKYALGKGVKKAEIEHSNLPAGVKARPSDVADHIEGAQPLIGVNRRGEIQGLTPQEDAEFAAMTAPGAPFPTGAAMDRYRELSAKLNPDIPPQYERYQLPNGQNYREHILTLENQPNDQTYYAKLHWGSTPNPLAHIRMSDRQIGNRKILHVEELQSDWNNDARRKGFRTGNEKKAYEDYVTQMRVDAINGIDPTASPMIRRALRDKYHVMDPYMLAMKLGRQEEHRQMEHAARGSTGVPKAPYINPDRDDVSELAMKHVLMEAAKGGYNGIAFTPDEAQSERWGGTEFNGIYNKKLPSIAQKLIRQHDPQGGSDDDPQIIAGWGAPHVELTDKARDSINQNGFSSFRRGGYVTHVRRAR